MSDSVEIFDKDLTEAARKLIRKHQARDLALGKPGLFGDPAWDIMLALFVAGEEDRPFMLSEACTVSTLSPPTVQRYLKVMEMRALVEIKPHETDHQDSYLALKPMARVSMTQILALN
ncbi:MAG: hypothetical protein RL367_1112 [Pseudomonadota bacterium]|jgi:DNA-binding MarR family transcriptional regulator